VTWISSKARTGARIFLKSTELTGSAANRGVRTLGSRRSGFGGGSGTDGYAWTILPSCASGGLRPLRIYYGSFVQIRRVHVTSFAKLGWDEENGDCNVKQGTNYG